MLTKTKLRQLAYQMNDNNQLLINIFKQKLFVKTTGMKVIHFKLDTINNILFISNKQLEINKRKEMLVRFPLVS